ncbi:hypothetical protein RUND412_010502 [Rhizina undulata]
MLCAISGEAPTTPVASVKSGSVFEKRLIEAYIAEHGKDPVTGEELTTADLIELKSNRTIRPRPPTLTSIPALLATFQNEWDALALETHTLRQQLTQTRQELSTALYQHDAATRVIARLLKERDEAREALSKVSVGTGAAVGGDAMEVDAGGVPEYVKEKIEVTMKEKSATRRKRAVPEDWATPDDISTYKEIFTSDPLYPGATSLSLDPTGELVLLGGKDGVAGIYSLSQQVLVVALKADDGAVTDVAWAGKRAVTAYANGTVKIWNEKGDDSVAVRSHAGEVRAISLHPCGELLASVGVDKSWVLYDLEAGKAVAQVYGEEELTTCHFHPDGHLFAAGTPTSVQIYDVRTTEIGATFGPLPSPVSSLHFSENGFWLSLATQGQSTVEIWDLRKMAQTKVLDIGSRVDHVRWDYSGQFLLATGPSGVSVQAYSKATKSWSEPLRSAVMGVAAEWGSGAERIVVLNGEGGCAVLGK